jgi:tellurite resistance-related uncharacterized protein
MDLDRAKPYRSTPVFDEASLPAALRREHRTKPGAWGLIRVLEGEVVYTIIEPSIEPGSFCPIRRIS